MNNIDLCVFISSKDRFGRINDFKATLNSFKNLIDLSFFKQRFLSFKKFKGDNFENIFNFFILLNFNIYSIDGEFNGDRINDRTKLISNILQDICLFFTNNDFSEYLFLLEDDSPIIIKNKNLQYYIDFSVKELENDKNLCSIHFPRLSVNYTPCNPDYYLQYHKLKIENELIRFNYFYNFQPRVVRFLDVINASKFILDNWNNFKNETSPEEGFKNGLLNINKDFKFWGFSPFNAYSIHLGEEPQYHKMILESEPSIKYEN